MQAVLKLDHVDGRGGPGFSAHLASLHLCAGTWLSSAVSALRPLALAEESPGLPSPR